MSEPSLLQMPVPWLLFVLAVLGAGARFAQLRWRDVRREPARVALRDQASAARQQLASMQA